MNYQKELTLILNSFHLCNIEENKKIIVENHVKKILEDFSLNIYPNYDTRVFTREYIFRDFLLLEDIETDLKKVFNEVESILKRKFTIKINPYSNGFIVNISWTC